MMGLRTFFVLLLSCSLIGCGGGGGGDSASGGASPPAGNQIKVGAHYYLWFPQKFNEGILRTKLSPPQEPELGIYDSASVAVVEQHISQAKLAGIDFFTLLWSPVPSDAKFNSIISDSFLRARNISDIEFCLFYGTDGLAKNKHGGIAVIDDDSKAKFNRDLEFFASDLFQRPNYLRVNGKPVLILYLTRTLVGDYAAMFREGRELLRQKGVEVFFLADEIFWSVTTHREGPDSSVSVSGDPQPGRIALFDAIFAYNMYEGAFPQQQGYGVDSTFIPDIKALYDRYRQALPGDVSFVPYAMPGYNDRGVRPQVDHFAIPREFAPGQGEASFYREFVKNLVYPYLDSRNNLALITSWNEWSEDTAIEPLSVAPPTTNDVRSGDLTQGYKYSGFANAYLQATREAFSR